MKNLITAFCLLICLPVFSQTTLTGQVADTASRKNLQHAVVAILKASDSTLYLFTRTDASGRFRLPGVRPGKYALLVSFPGFMDYVDTITVKSGRERNLGSIPLTATSRMLDVVFIRSVGAIRIKGDTTEFIADSFRLREGATVEELLKKLPGFQVNSRGEITAQGQRVQKVLVDGEEFFGDDPTMATRNISARAVDRVQVYDSRSDHQRISGTQGSEGRTVNIKLKEEFRKGSFGKAEAGRTRDELDDMKLMFNRFSGKKKMSVYGTKSTVSAGNLNWNERRQLGMEPDYEFDEISGIAYRFNSDNTFENWSLQGLPDSYSAGALYLNRWNNDRNALNLNYRYNQLESVNDASSSSQTILPDTVFYSGSSTRTGGLNRQHAVSIKYEWKIDSLASFRIISSNLRRETTSHSLSTSSARNAHGSVINNGNRTVTGEGMQDRSENQFVYRQLFRKKNRQLVTTARFTYVRNNSEGMLYFRNSFFNDGAMVQSDTSDQFKTSGSLLNLFGGKITYSEPLSATWNIVADYSYNASTTSSQRFTYEKAANGKYETLNTLFSNDFNLGAYSHAGSLFIKHATRKTRISFGSGISSLQMDLVNNDLNSSNNYHFLNFTPQLGLSFSEGQRSNISLNYRGTTLQPSIEQLQPLRDNQDPMNLVIGNPGLKVGFSHNISMMAGSYKLLAQRGFWVNASVNLKQDAITSYNLVDSFGRRIYYPVNTNGNYNWFLWTEMSFGEGEKKWIRTIQVNASGGRIINYINDRRNETNSMNIDLGHGFRYEHWERFAVFLYPRAGWNHSVSSVQPDRQNSFFTYGGDVEASLMIGKRLEIKSELHANLRQETDAFGRSLDYTIWNGSISQSFFKKNNGRISLLCHDLLDQNLGVDRVITTNFISENRFQRIGRYFMLKLEWSFNTSNANAQN